MILLIDNYDSFTYNLYQIIAAFDKEVRVIRNNKITVEEVFKLNPEAILLSPGPGRPQEAGICIDLIKTLVEKRARIPLLGICLGHQALGAAFDCNIILADEVIHGKSDSIFHYGKNFYHSLPLPFQAGRYHSLVIEKESLSSELIIESVNSRGLIMGIRHHDLPLYGVQFHPESILTPQGALFLEEFVKSIPIQ